MHWFEYIIVIVAVPLLVWMLIGWLKADYRWEEEKRLDRLYGGKSPETIEREKALALRRWKGKNEKSKTHD
jgi:hypothetical protein